jgi:hypothetical protein
VTDGPWSSQSSRAPPKQLSPAHSSHAPIPPGSSSSRDGYFSESKLAVAPRAVPLNIDELPVGRGAGNPYIDDSAADSRFSSSAASRRKGSPRAASSPRESKFDEDEKHAEFHDDGGYDDAPHSPRGVGNDTRPIRPKATESYNDPDAFLGEEEVEEGFPEKFPPGQHPLQGVPNFQDLGAPELLRGKSRYVYCSRALFIPSLSVFIVYGPISF